ncbi:MAG: LysR family transcriptional regulator [Dermatophilus congolensis]|nr:LysR family transcriptional regulator [Dermatophilus congolensis]
MDFRQLEYFQAVIEAGSLSQAAKNLKMTQPPLSLAIAKLEKELGVTLLQRTAKGVHPTRAGLFLLENGGRLLTRRDRVADTLRRMGEGIVGELRIGAEPMVINEIVADALGHFVRQAPGARINLLDTAPGDILGGLLRGDIDVGCVPFDSSMFADFVTDECHYMPVVDIQLKLAVPNAWANFENHDGRGWSRWILPRRLPAFPGMPETVEKALGTAEYLDILEVTTPQTALPLVAAGLGVTPTTERMASKQPGVTMLPAPSWLKSMRATLLWRRNSEVTPLMQRWFDVMRTVAGPPPSRI